VRLSIGSRGQLPDGVHQAVETVGATKLFVLNLQKTASHPTAATSTRSQRRIRGLPALGSSRARGMDVLELCLVPRQDGIVVLRGVDYWITDAAATRLLFGFRQRIGASFIRLRGFRIVKPQVFDLVIFIVIVGSGGLCFGSSSWALNGILRAATDAALPEPGRFVCALSRCRWCTRNGTRLGFS